MEFLSRRGWSVAVALVLGFGVTAAAWAAPSVKSVETQPASRPLAIGELAHKLEPFAADARLKGMKFGLCIIDVAGGEKIFASGQDRPLMPASNMKLATTAAALTVLGDDWRFRTMIGTLGKDLVVVGGGDPNLSGRFYNGDPAAAVRKWAAALKTGGVTQIAGDLVFDDSLFESTFVHQNWPPKQFLDWYEAPVGALALNDSCVDVVVRGAAKAGLPALVTLSPPTAYFQITGQVMTRDGLKPRDETFFADRARPSTTLLLKGAVSPGWQFAKPLNRTVPDPGMFAATVIKETLRAEGVAVAGQVVRRKVWTADWRMPQGFTPLVYHYSTLAQSVRVANKNSQNFYAECMLKALAAYGESQDHEWPTAQGSWAAGDRAVPKALEALGVPTSGCVFDDGCGLSRTDRMTAETLARILVVMAKHPRSDIWMDSLAVAGDTMGTLRKRMKNKNLAGRVFAKTGLIDGVKALSGYVKSDSGRLIAFSMLVNDVRNNFAVNEWEDDICETLLKY
jgi:D-alanyl-D-alanine carboxypeptidase/D-alanyl-D-alanine-endopeptidase (penicillin-binding protein 4)